MTSIASRSTPADQLKSMKAELTDHIDAYLEVRIPDATEEMRELVGECVTQLCDLVDSKIADLYQNIDRNIERKIRDTMATTMGTPATAQPAELSSIGITPEQERELDRLNAEAQAAWDKFARGLEAVQQSNADYVAGGSKHSTIETWPEVLDYLSGRSK